MRDNPYKRLPPLERKPGGFLYRMTPAQRKQANALIRRECCHCDDGNCIALVPLVTRIGQVLIADNPSTNATK